MKTDTVSELPAEAALTERDLINRVGSAVQALTAFHSDRAWRHIYDAKIKLQGDLNMLDVLTRGTSPCGHWSAHAVTMDGGKHITCLDCDLAETQKRVETIEQATRESIVAYVKSCREDDTDRPCVQVFDVMAKHIRDRVDLGDPVTPKGKR